MKAQDLKNSILQLAIQGKLVPQDPNDEPAAELLKKIKAEKAELVKQGKIKKDKQESHIYKGDDNKYYEQIGTETKDITDEIPFDIPNNWEWVRIKFLCDTYTGNSISENIKKSKYTNLSAGYNYIGTKDVGFDNTINYENGVKIPFKEEKFRYAYPEDILLCIEGGSAGKKIAILSQTVCFGNKLCDFHQYLNQTRYLYYLLQSPYFFGIFKENISGIIGGVSINKIKELIIPLPPLSEQKRIVKKIEELEPFIEEYGQAETELTELNTNFPEQIKKSILQYAIQGKLVEQDPNDEPASELLKKIQAEKAELVKQGKIKKDKQESYIFKGDDNRHYEQIGSEVRDITDEIPFEIPNSWEWCRLGQISDVLNGYAYKSTSYVSKSNNQIIRLGNVKKNLLLIDVKQIYISDKDAQRTESFRIRNNDILVTLTGTRAKRDYFYSTVYYEKENSPNLYLNQRVGLLRCNTNLIIPEMLQIILNGDDLLNTIFSTETGTANQGNIGTNNVQKLLVALPPINEQKRIVDKMVKLRNVIESL